MDDLTLGIVVSVELPCSSARSCCSTGASSPGMAALQTTATAHGWEYTPIREGRTSWLSTTGRTQGSAWTLESTLTASSADSESSTSTGPPPHVLAKRGRRARRRADPHRLRARQRAHLDPQALGGLAGRVVQKALN